MKWKTKKTTWVFWYIKYGKFWSISLEHFVERKPLIYEECTISLIVYLSITTKLFAALLLTTIHFYYISKAKGYKTKRLFFPEWWKKITFYTKNLFYSFVVLEKTENQQIKQKIWWKWRKIFQLFHIPLLKWPFFEPKLFIVHCIVGNIYSFFLF